MNLAHLAENSPPGTKIFYADGDGGLRPVLDAALVVHQGTGEKQIWIFEKAEDVKDMPYVGPPRGQA